MDMVAELEKKKTCRLVCFWVSCVNVSFNGPVEYYIDADTYPRTYYL
jgi:hypothetical protein